MSCSALIMRTQLSRSHRHIAYERFHQEGAIAMVPLQGNECATIWTASSQTIQQLTSYSDDAFLRTLQSLFGYRLGRLQGVNQRISFPFQTVQAMPTESDQVLLLGNAAHTVHPIAAQGLNMAFYEIALLMEYAYQAPLPFKKINERIQSQIAANLRISDALPRWLFQNVPGINVLLSLGMLGLDSVTFAKRAFLLPLLGRRGFTPRLLLSKVHDVVATTR